MRIAIGSDEATPLTEYVAGELLDRGHQIVRVVALALGDDPRWPAVGRKVGTLVASGACDEGVVFCFTGTGVSMAANKVPGVRAALCTDAQTAAFARR
jgi:ribose 5-phosphate isomerase B